MEVIFETERNISETFELTLTELKGDNVIRVEDNSVYLLKSGHSYYDFICALLWPFIDCNILLFFIHLTFFKKSCVFSLLVALCIFIFSFPRSIS